MSPLKLRVPATSANLGPGFDVLALALSLYLEVEAEVAESFGISASGRDAELCGNAENNLLLEVFRATWECYASGLAPALRLRVRNEIPLGMGCGSSAAARVAGVVLASHFGGLAWDRRRVFEEAARLEGHPDNVAACVFGGFTVSAESAHRCEAASFAVPRGWSVLLAVPEEPLATSESRAVLPDMYSRADAIANLQYVSLLTAGFMRGDAELVKAGMQDRMHQPYRAAVCRLLADLLPLAERGDVLGVVLSGAGPSVLVLTESSQHADVVQEMRRAMANDRAEILPVAPDGEGLRAWSRDLPLW